MITERCVLVLQYENKGQIPQMKYAKNVLGKFDYELKIATVEDHDPAAIKFYSLKIMRSWLT